MHIFEEGGHIEWKLYLCVGKKATFKNSQSKEVISLFVVEDDNEGLLKVNMLYMVGLCSTFGLHNHIHLFIYLLTLLWSECSI